MRLLNLSLLTAICVALAGCASSSTNSTALSATDSSDAYSSFSRTYLIPYNTSSGTLSTTTAITSTLRVNAQINGGTVGSYTVDTGSVGVVVPASEIPNLPTNGTAGSLTYSSSGLKLDGTWVNLPVTFPSAVASDGNGTATATIPVLAVTTGSCTGSGVNSANCTGTIPHMLGVGFGRGTTVTTAPTYNPFINLAEMKAGTMRRGYTITRSGITLGLTTVAVSGYTRQTLTNAGTPADGTKNDWNIPTGSFTLNGTTYTGTFLLDTGLLNMIIEATGLPTSGTATAGANMTITMGPPAYPQSYTFKVGDTGVQTPTNVSYASAPHGAYVNTGLRALSRFDYMFDADGGFAGLRPVN